MFAAIKKVLKSKAFQKSLTWRFIALIVTFGIVFLATGSLAMAGSIGLVDVLLKTILYYSHEKLWENWGNG